MIWFALVYGERPVFGWESEISEVGYRQYEGWVHGGFVAVELTNEQAKDFVVSGRATMHKSNYSATILCSRPTTKGERQQLMSELMEERERELSNRGICDED